MSTLRPVALVDRVVSETVAEVRAKRLPMRSVPPVREEAFSPEELCNVRAKRLFVDRIVAVLGTDESVRSLAEFFGVKKSTLHERMREARRDLAPLPEWFQKLDDYAEFQRLHSIFVRSA